MSFGVLQHTAQSAFSSTIPIHSQLGALSLPSGDRVSILNRMTTKMLDHYRLCNPNFSYELKLNPRRVLTKPSEGVSNRQYDNINADLIIYVNDIFEPDYPAVGHKYRVLDLLGQGTFGQVVRCQNLTTGAEVAVKVVKNKPAYSKQGLIERQILKELNQKHDPEDKAHIVRLIDSFEYQKHLCLVFELLRINLYELIKMNQHRGFSMNLVRIFLKQIIEAQIVLTRAQCIHCDLKPENILLCDLSSPHIKIIDFGSACYENRTIYTYIQSRFYRSPEVILGTNYTSAIDLWSIGCIAAELFFGLPLFPGHSEYNQLQRIIDMLGVPPESMLEKGKNINKYFSISSSPTGARKFQLKSEQLYALETGTQAQPSKRYFAFQTLPENVEKFSNKKLNASEELSHDELLQRRCFTHFLLGLLHLDPSLRWTAEQAIEHPFLTGAPFDGIWSPPEKLKPVQLHSTGIPIPITNSNYGFARDPSPRQTGPSSLPMNLTHYSPQSFQLGQSPSTASPLSSGNPANLPPHGYMSLNPHPGQGYPMYAANLHLQNRSHMNPASGGPSPGAYTTGGRPRASTRDAFASGSNASYVGGYRSKQQIASQQNPQAASLNGKEFSVPHQSPASRNNSHSPTTKFNPNSNSSAQVANPRQKNTRHRKTLSSTGQFPSSSKPDRANSNVSGSLSNSHPNVSNQAFAPGQTEQYSYVPPAWTPANPNQNTATKPPASSGHYARRRSVTEDDETVALWDPFYDEDDHSSPTGKKSKSPVYSGRQGSGGIGAQYMGTIPSPSNFSSSHMNPLSMNMNMNMHPSLPPGGKAGLSSSLNIPTSNHPGGYLPMGPPMSRSGGYPFPNYPADYTGSLGTSPMGPPTLFGYPGFSQGTPTRMRPYVPPSQPQNVPTVGSASGGFVYPTSEPEYFPSIDPSPRTHGFEFVPLGSSYEKPAFSDASSRQSLRNTEQQPGTGYPVADNRDKSKPVKSVRRYPTYPAKEK